eukprot:5619274-Pyramimonas_sp.AAC.1
MVGANVLDWVGLDGPIAVVPHAGVGAAYYRFRAPLTVAQLTAARSAGYRRLGMPAPAGLVH